MTKNLMLLLYCAVLVSSAPVAATARQAVLAPAHDGAHDMDFSIGTWRTEITTFTDPFEHPDRSIHMSGTKKTSFLWNGKAVVEEIEADGPNGHWEAANLFLYDPAGRQWSQNYVDAETGRFEGSPGIGEFHDGKFEFYWQAKIRGRAILERGTWSDFTPTSHTYRIDRSNDGGRSWLTSFVAYVTKIQ